MPERLFSRVLIANRGEIVVRIARTCHDLGIGTVAIYSSADENALHTQVCDEAYCVGPPPAIESYLSIDRVLRAAVDSGAEAVHPGYGFLAENAEFARAVQEAGLTWVGPPPEAIALMGDKVAAKELARASAVPVVPGYEGEDQSLARLREESERIGFPVMIKAASGGGGRGMRVVAAVDELDPAVEGARREAHSAFGDDRVFLEKLLARPRHIEVQLFVDSHGGAVYLGERDCSLQRRHQKVVEEAPSPVMTPEIRTAMGEAALRLARRAGYVNAGTVEFLFSGDQFYFLEMNTRIQVEHPVTEVITGLDLIRLQLEVASGRPLGFSQLDVSLQGHGIEVRVYAEDPQNGFLPSAGTLTEFVEPDGPGVRVDSGVYAGAEVPPYYDPMLAKLVIHAGSREQAVSRLVRALDDFAAQGVTTNLPFLRWIAGQPDFRMGRVHTGFIDEHWTPQATARSVPDEVLIAAAAFQASASAGRTSGSAASDPWTAATGWRHRGMARTFVYQIDGRLESVRIAAESGSVWRVEKADSTNRVRVQPSEPGTILLRFGHRAMRFGVQRSGDVLHVTREGSTYSLRIAETAVGGLREPGERQAAGAAAPMPGTVVKVLVEPGQHVQAHQPLAILEAMKMEHVIDAPHAGTVRAVLFAVGAMVPAGAKVVELEDE